MRRYGHDFLKNYNITVSMTGEMHDIVKEIAYSEGESASSWVRNLIVNELEKREKWQRKVEKTRRRST